MANQEQLSILKQGVEVWNKWRENNLGKMIDLRGAHLGVIQQPRASRYKSFHIDTANSGVNSSPIDLSSANLSGANLSDAHLGGMNLSKTNLIDADLKRTDLSRANLKGANLWRADIRGAWLSNADLSETNLERADLEGADLGNAVLKSAYLNSASFWNVNLEGANFEGAILKKTNLSKAKLKGSSFAGAFIGETVLFGVDLTSIYGIEEINHIAPSCISVDTLHLLKGNISIGFLRGCGLSDLDIEYSRLAANGLDAKQVSDLTYKIHELYLGNGIQFYSCFISYSSRDQDFAQKLHDDLQNNGVRCWFDREDLKIGDSIRPTIDRQIRLRDKLLVILSENSIKSEWVGDEVEGALEEEQKGNRSVLFPIRLDDTALNTRDDWAAKIKRRRHIGDFSNWKDKASYQKAFERLLRDLKATGE